jgi:transposase
MLAVAGMIMATKSPAIKINIIMTELEDALRRAKESLSEKDYAILQAVADAYGTISGLVEHKNITIARLHKMLFGASTEKTKTVLGDKKSPPSLQTLSTSTSAVSDSSVSASAEASDSSAKAKGHGRNGADDYPGATKVAVPHESLQAGDPCPKCENGTVYATGRPGVLVRLIGQAPISAMVYELEKLRCNLCGELFTAKAPAEVGKEKYDATASSMVALLKYGTGMPFHREEKLQANLGIPLPASTQWDIVEAQAERIEPVFEELIRRAADGEILHNDDTTVKILEMMGKRAAAAIQQPERRGMFTSGIISIGEGRKIAVFLSGRQHAGENLRDVLLHRSQKLPEPIQMCDALPRNLPGELQTIVAHCLAHSRRRFVDVIEQFPDECRYVLESLATVYRNDALARERNMSPSARRHFHQAESGPVMQKLHIWLDQQLADRLVEPNSSLGGAITYMLKHWDRLTLFLRVPGAPLDNNICERALRRAILHRKNALFYKTGYGARVGDLFMSLIHTSELNGVNPFDYLTELDRHAAELSSSPQNWLPWNYRQTLAAL